MSMFGSFNLEQINKKVEEVKYEPQDDSRYTSADSNHVTIIDTPLGRVYINAETYFSSVPKSVWEASFVDEPSPRQFLEEKIGTELKDQDIVIFQQLLEDLISAEFKLKSQSA
jgi:hypothetical protein